jgi:hypothetical protein
MTRGHDLGNLFRLCILAWVVLARRFSAGLQIQPASFSSTSSVHTCRHSACSRRCCLIWSRATRTARSKLQQSKECSDGSRSFKPHFAMPIDREPSVFGLVARVPDTASKDNGVNDAALRRYALAACAGNSRTGAELALRTTTEVSASTTSTLSPGHGLRTRIVLAEPVSIPTVTILPSRT